jgi:hypothetical protein
LWRLLREGNFMQGCRGTGAPGDMEMQQQPFGHDLPASDVSRINFPTMNLTSYFGLNKGAQNSQLFWCVCVTLMKFSRLKLKFNKLSGLCADVTAFRHAGGNHSESAPFQHAGTCFS